MRVKAPWCWPVSFVKGGNVFVEEIAEFTFGTVEFRFLSKKKYERLWEREREKGRERERVELFIVPYFSVYNPHTSITRIVTITRTKERLGK